MLRKVIYSLTLTLILTIFFGLLNLNSQGDSQRVALDVPQGVTLGSQGDTLLNLLQKPVEVSARVGGYTIEALTGWASPYAEVSLSSQGLERKTTCDGSGFFAFYFIPVPNNLGELCLIAQDVNQLPSFPNCLAPPPKNMSLKIENVLLPPTISLASGKIPVGRTTKASGMTFPNSDVDVFMFTEKNWTIVAWIKNVGAGLVPARTLFNIGRPLGSPLQIIKTAYAAGLPIYRIRSNENGYFEFSLPANTPSNNRVFATANFASGTNPRESAGDQRKSSPKSNTLSFTALGILGILGMFLKDFFQQAGKFFLGLRNDPLIIVFIEILVLVGLIGAILAKKALQEKDPRKSLPCR